ncbi:MAG: MmgE/PrpD family protein [Vampirovibrionales bacterium]|nr:MmgE/PrpD family protein [Vampirovibrionales bacterium]
MALSAVQSKAQSHAVLGEPLLAHRLADYAFNLSADAIPKACLQEAKRRIIDSLGCAMGAIDSDPARIAREHALSVSPASGFGGCTVIGTHHTSSPELGAFANGVLFRYLDFNDTYLSKEPAHPSDNIAAILAVGEMNGNSGKEILAAIVLAYEIQCRLCDAYSIRSRGWDHVTYGSFSTALACGKLLGFTKEQYVHALGLAGTPNNAMRQTRVGELSNWKGCAFANASRNGVFAALLAHRGLTGPSEIFEGEMGFFNQICGGTAFELPAMGGETLAGQVKHDEFMILKTYIKHFPAEYHSQSAIEAALALRPLIGDWKNITKITIQSFNAAVEIIAGFKEHWAPSSRETADHSMPYVVSAALVDGDITLESFTMARIKDPELLSLVQKVSVEANEEMNAGYPKGIPNKLIIETKDGRELVEYNAYPLGHAHNPMTNADVEAKFKKLSHRVFDNATVQQQLDILWDFENLSSVTPALKAFARG